MPDTSESIVFRHPMSLCESQNIGAGTSVWAFAHVMDGAVVGKNCNIGDHAFVETGAILGDRITVKNGVMIWDGVTVESDAFIGPGVIFTNDRHPRSRRLAEAASRYETKKEWLAPTRVLRGASIGAGAVLLPGITVGRFATIAAGTCVTKDVSHHGLITGRPGKRIGWVCFCGMTLNQSLACAECGRRFERHHDSIAAAE